MSRFRVFVGAPSKTDLQNEQNYYHWQTIPSKSIISETSVVILLPATLNAASRRVSRIYQNIIFDEEDEERHCDGYQEDETIISWPPTVPKDTTESRIEITMPSFLSRDPSSILAQTPYETQETQNSTSFAYSDASSIARFPAFQFNLHSLTALSTISASKASRKVSVLLAALEVEGPDTIRIKKGVDMGKEVTILKMILGDEDGNVCKLTAWREVAESWGGLKEDPIVKRGDVLLIENVMAVCDLLTTPAPSLTASPYLKSKSEICFRTMPCTHEDNRLRPDLRLGGSDAAVKRVATLVRWFETVAGL